MIASSSKLERRGWECDDSRYGSRSGGCSRIIGGRGRGRGSGSGRACPSRGYTGASLTRAYGDSAKPSAEEEMVRPW